MSEYTPGPWKVGGECKPLYAWRGQVTGKHPDDGEDFILASCNHNYPEIALANARLIAAAPDLLEALIEMMRPKSEGMGSLERRAVARAAIAKAEGRKEEG
jgi:hypothetical protein